MLYKRSGLPIVAVVVTLLVPSGCEKNRALQQAETSPRSMPQFENESVKVWKSIFLPGQPTAMHRHDHPSVIAVLNGGTMKIVSSKGQSQSHRWETGKAYWQPASPPEELHSLVNEGTEPIEVMTIELEKEK